MGVVRNLTVNTTSAGSVGTTLTNLHSFTLPANTLVKANDYLRATYMGVFGINTNTKRVVVSFGGLTVEDTALIDLEGLGWKVTVEYTFVTATSILASLLAIFGQMQFNAAGAGFSGVGCRTVSRGGLLSVSDVTVNSTPMLVQGQGTSASDVTQNLSIIEVVNN